MRRLSWPVELGMSEHRFAEAMASARKGASASTTSGNAGKTLGSTKCADNSAGNTVLEKSILPNVYTVTEAAEPAGFEFGGLSCEGGSTSTNNTTRQATVTLKPGDEVVCVFQNNEQFGALKITKVSSKPAAARLSGAKFSITLPSGTTEEVETKNGEICRDGLSELGNYTVKETKAPTGYSIDDETAHTVNVTGSSPGPKCAEASFTGQSLQFKDTPLTDVSATATSEVSGGTESTITCTNSSSTNVGNSPQSGGSATVTAKGLTPGTYDCKVVIDP
jgi:uncharacterized surface anchored protein